MTYTVSLDWDEAQRFWTTGSGVLEGHYGRFEAMEIPRAQAGEATSIADRMIAAPEFKNGSMLWCDTYVEALLLVKVHRAAGYTVHLLWDMAESNDNGDLWGHCVLTTWNVMGDRT